MLDPSIFNKFFPQFTSNLGKLEISKYPCRFISFLLEINSPSVPLVGQSGSPSEIGSVLTKGQFTLTGFKLRLFGDLTLDGVATSGSSVIGS